jgi:hypothetical protein
MALDFPNSPTDGQVYDNFYYDAVKGTWKSLSAGSSPSILENPTITNATITDAVITATSDTSTTVPITVNGAASQSANLQEWKNSAGIQLSSVSSVGTVRARGFESFNAANNHRTLFIGDDAGGQLEIGRTDGIAANPYIDFHSGATATDFDSRIRGTGGNGTSGQGTIEMFASDVSLSGRLRAINQPYFLAYSSGGGTVTYNANQVVRFDVIRRQVGSNYNTSNSRFTAPVTGNYFLWFTAFNVGGTQRVSLRINGGSGVFGQGGSANSIDYHQAGVTYMAAGDYAEVRVAYDNTSLFLSDNHSEFGGLLLG